MARRLAGWLLASQVALGAGADEVAILPVHVDDHRPVAAAAELLLDTWYDHSVIALPSSDNGIVVPSTRDELCAVWPGGCATGTQVEARLLLSAPGLAPLLSDRFRWPKNEHGADAEETLEVGFSLAPAPTFSANGALAVPMRPADARLLRLHDGAGRPLGGVTLDLAIYFSTGGHCASIRSRPLGTVTTDAEGTAAIPDGDFEYHLEIETPHVVFSAAPNPRARQTLVTPLREGSAELVVFRPRALRIQVVGVGDPESVVLGGCIQDCPGGVCGACCGTLAESNATGEVEIRDFYTDELSEIYLSSDGREIWRATVGDLDLGGPPIVVTPAVGSIEPGPPAGGRHLPRLPTCAARRESDG